MKIAQCKMDEWKAKTEAATKGPWGVFRAGVDTGAGTFVHERAECGRTDAEFIAMAREAMPLLMARVEELEKFEPPVCEQCGEYQAKDEDLGPEWCCWECD